MIDQFLFNILVLIWTGIAVLIFIVLWFNPAPYGRLPQKGYGALLESTIGWVLMEAVSFSIMAFLFILTLDLFSVAHIISLLWLGHYGYRSFLFPFLRKKGAATMPVLVMIMAMFFNVMNAGVNGLHLFYQDNVYDLEWLMDLRFLFGVLLFMIGLTINITSDTYLRSLRKHGEKTYKIPQKALFRFISCPNYMGEIIEWCGWALLTFSLAGLSFAIWSIANLLPRAFSYHQWYKNTFPEYPENRKAIIPFLL